MMENKFLCFSAYAELQWAPEARFALRPLQPSYRFDERVLGDPRRVQAHMPSGFDDSRIQIQASRLFISHKSTSSHMKSCADGLFIAH